MPRALCRHPPANQPPFASACTPLYLRACKSLIVSCRSAAGREWPSEPPGFPCTFRRPTALRWPLPQVIPRRQFPANARMPFACYNRSGRVHSGMKYNSSRRGGQVQEGRAALAAAGRRRSSRGRQCSAPGLSKQAWHRQIDESSSEGGTPNKSIQTKRQGYTHLPISAMTAAPEYSAAKAAPRTAPGARRSHSESVNWGVIMDTRAT